MRSWARRIHMLVAWAFVVAVVIQVFLIGLHLFAGEDIALHREWGYNMGLLALALVIAAVVGRLPRRAIGWDVVLVVVYFVQTILPVVGVPLIEALHPVNALFVFGLSVLVAVRAREFAPSPYGTAPADRSAAPVTPASSTSDTAS